MSGWSAFTLLLVLAIPTPSQARLGNVSCDDSARMAQRLEQTMSAERRGMGLRDPDTLLEIWVVPDRGDWFVVQRYANGTSCIVAMGAHWDAMRAGPSRP